jgi:site-specific DNA recombinase
MEKGPKGCGMQTVDEEKLKESFMRLVNRLITEKETFISSMLDNVEKVIHEQASAVDMAAIDERLKELHGEMSALVKLNLTTGIDDTIYSEEYNRIAAEMESLRNQRTGITQAALMRQDTLDRVQEIGEVLRSMDGVQKFDEELFGRMVERIKVMNMVQVEFVMWSGSGVVELL